MERRFNIPNRALIPVLVPMFLIISSSVYPAIISSMENKEMQIISKVMAKLNEKNIDTSSHHANLPLSSSQDLTPTSPTPIDSSLSSSPSTSKELNATQTTPQQQQLDEEVDNKMVANVINSGEQVHTVWTDNTPVNNDIFYKRDGADFDPTTENLSDNAGISISPAIAVAGNNVHIVWEEDNEILYKRSITSGATFGATINLSDNAGASNSPRVAISGNNVLVVWRDNTPGNFDIMYRRSTDGGASFTELTKNLSSNTGDSSSSDIAVSGGSVHVVWRDFTPGNADILYKKIYR